MQLLGKAHSATTVTGSLVDTDNFIDIATLMPMLRQPLGLELDSLSVVSIGSRRGITGDYPRVYDQFIGTPPYAGRRETWLIARLPVITNTEALRWRTTVGAATVALAQRIAAALRVEGLRARVGTATELVELDRRLGAEALASPAAQKWKALRTEAGWVSAYAYPAKHLNSQALAQAWNLPADEVVQNVTIYPDRTCTATVSVRTPMPLPTPPTVILRRLNGEQAAAAAANMCGPRPRLRGLQPSPIPRRLPIEIGPSGVLIGKLANGDRLMMPLTDPGEPSRVFVAAEDAIAKRIVIRTVGAGERVSVHTRDKARWASVRMPELSLVGEPRPAPRTTVSVIDGPISPTPRPSTLITIAEAGTRPPEINPADVTIEQVNRAMLRVSAAGKSWMVEMDLFRAENRYVSREPITMSVAN
ncbi:ESX conserved componant EccE2 [Mycolicibacterium novocastrense]|uniref:ESX conserved componant EccE2 n=1 Tax=Mycolicibacterium novocastrense TaxID=59813 RepID=A0ABQ0KDP8_MYCNV|nr:ESX conserved componant EccE2 [Mycolicibacterium novocastrense]